MDELRRIEAQIRQASTLDELRSLFDRVQMLRRAFADDFDLQLAIANVQHQLVERGRLLQESTRQRRPVSEEQSREAEMARARQRAGVEGEVFESD